MLQRIHEFRFGKRKIIILAGVVKYVKEAVLAADEAAGCEIGLWLMAHNSGRVPQGFKVRIREVKLSAGAGFLVAVSGEIMLMPGLGKSPSAFNIDVDEKGRITGLF